MAAQAKQPLSARLAATTIADAKEQRKPAMAAPPQPAAAPWWTEASATAALNTASVRALFMSEVKIEEHVREVTKDANGYVKQIMFMINNKLWPDVTVPVKGRALAALTIAKQNDFSEWLLSQPGVYSVPEVLRAAQILDGPRKADQLKRKLALFEERRAANMQSVRRITLSKLRLLIGNAEAESWTRGPGRAGCSGAFAKRVRRWAARYSEDSLEFFLLNFPKENWKELADLVHFHAEDFAVPYFLACVHGAPPPANSLLGRLAEVTPANLLSICSEFPQIVKYYSFLRRRINELVAAGAAPPSEAAQLWLTKHVPLEDVLWQYDEFKCKGSDAVMAERLKSEVLEAARAGADGRLSFGKLVERLLYFREKGFSFYKEMLPLAEAKLGTVHIPNAERFKVAVFGDASGSMQVAIKCANILASLMSVALNASLTFFNTKGFAPSKIPRSTAQILDVCEEVKADGGTSMAAALWPFYKQRIKLDLIILVSDEDENAVCENGEMFAQLLRRYGAEVAPNVKVFLVSFLNVGQEGVIYSRLKEAKQDHRVLKQFRLDGQRPDTSKFDALLGMVKMEVAGLLG